MKAIVRFLRRLNRLRDDPRPIPPLTHRRIIVVLISTAQLAIMTLTALASPTFMALSLLLWPATAWFSWSATRNLAFTSSRPLDEWQRDQAHRAFRTAFWIIAAAVLIAGLTLANLDLNTSVDIAPIDFSGIAAVLYVVGLFTVPWIPVAVLGWKLPDEEPEPADSIALQT